MRKFAPVRPAGSPPLSPVSPQVSPQKFASYPQVGYNWGVANPRGRRYVMSITALLDEIVGRLFTVIPDFSVYLATAIAVILLATLIRWVWKAVR